MFPRTMVLALHGEFKLSTVAVVLLSVRRIQRHKLRCFSTCCSPPPSRKCAHASTDGSWSRLPFQFHATHRHSASHSCPTQPCTHTDTYTHTHTRSRQVAHTCEHAQTHARICEQTRSHTNSYGQVQLQMQANHTFSRASPVQPGSQVIGRHSGAGASACHSVAPCIRTVDCQCFSA